MRLLLGGTALRELLDHVEHPGGRVQHHPCQALDGLQECVEEDDGPDEFVDLAEDCAEHGFSLIVGGLTIGWETHARQKQEPGLGLLLLIYLSMKVASRTIWMVLAAVFSAS